jgi:hypothetical protein
MTNCIYMKSLANHHEISLIHANRNKKRTGNGHFIHKNCLPSTRSIIFKLF